MYGQDVENWLHTHNESIEHFIWTVEIIGILLAFKFLFHLERITESMSTRFIGRFPDSLDILTDLVSHATRRIDVLWDGVDPGSYFRPEAHERLMDALLDRRQMKPKGVTIRFLVWGGPKAISAASGLRTEDFTPQMAKHFCNFHGSRGGFTQHLDDAFARIPKPNDPSATNWDKSKHSEAEVYNVKLEEIKSYLNCEKPDPNSPEFKALQLCLHEWVKYRLVDAGVDIIVPEATDHGFVPEIFFLIVDGNEAVFVLPCPGQNALAFRTSDSKLLESLEEKFTALFRQSTKPHPHD